MLQDQRSYLLKALYEYWKSVLDEKAPLQVLSILQACIIVNEKHADSLQLKRFENLLPVFLSFPYVFFPPCNPNFTGYGIYIQHPGSCNDSAILKYS